MKTFPMGGVHPSENKLSGAKPIEVLPLPDVVTIPLVQHIGAPAVAKVAKGDKVVTGQLIAEAGSFMSANIHAPVSGTVTAVDMVPNGQGLRQMMITIKREGDDWAELHGVGADGAVLVRPDGFVAWRAQGASPDPQTALRDALKVVLHRV